MCIYTYTYTYMQHAFFASICLSSVPRHYDAAEDGPPASGSRRALEAETTELSALLGSPVPVGSYHTVPNRFRWLPRFGLTILPLGTQERGVRYEHIGGALGSKPASQKQGQLKGIAVQDLVGIDS